MDQSLSPYLAIKKIDGDEIRGIITTKVKKIRKEIKPLPEKFRAFNKTLASEMNLKWEIEVKRGKGSETPQRRLKRMKEISKKYRLEVISQLTRKWYNLFWAYRSDLSLISAFYQLSSIESSPVLNAQWKPSKNTKFSPIILRMNGPRKPTKKKFKKSDINYNLEDAINKMLSPLENWVDETTIVVLKMKSATNKQSIKTKKTRFRESYIAREHLTVLCQAVSPRQSSFSSRKDNSNKTQKKS